MEVMTKFKACASPDPTNKIKIFLMNAGTFTGLGKLII
jgi:hypothetical protein